MNDSIGISRRRRATALATATVVGAALIVGAATPASAAPPAPDLHYAMDDATGVTVPDSSGGGLDGTITGATAVVDTEAGSALDITGGYVTIPRQALEGATDLTVSTRVRWDGAGGAWQWIYALGSNTDRYLFSTPSDGSGDFRSAVTRAGGGGESQLIGTGPLRAGEWVTVTVSLDTAADLVTTYLDGVAVASAPTDVSAADLLTADATSAGFIGRSFYPDPLFDGAVDDFRLYRTALSAEDVAALVEGELPTVTGLTETSFDLRTRVGDAPQLPSTVRADFSDEYARDVAIAWDAVPADSYATPGVFTVDGEAAGIPVTATVTVNRGEVRIDLGTDTGAVKGGASGVLYGLYGDGMPTDNLVEGMNVRSVATKAQDGSQHPGSDALEILPTLSGTTGGDVYLRITDWYRGFPYQWPGNTPEEKLADYRRVLDRQLEMIAQIPAEQREHLVIEPFNEPEGNMFGTGQWSLDRTSWLDDPTDYFAAWDATYRRIKEAFPDMRIAGPGTSQLFDQVVGFLDHVIEQDTVPDIITWHELTDPQAIRVSVEKYRGWEQTAFEGTSRAGTELPVNVNEYAFNYHTSVPGQMIQWISAIEETKIDAMIAFWNINGNLSDSAVQSNRANGQWWLYNAYSQLSGHTVELTPPSPGEDYTLQGVASLDEERRTARAIIGGGSGRAPVDVVNVPSEVFGDEVKVFVREIAWTGQLGDSAEPEPLAELSLPVEDGAVTIDFDGSGLSELTESSAYEIVITPVGVGTENVVSGTWDASYEAEDAAYTGSGYTRNGPEGSPSDVGKFYTSGGYNVGGLRTGSDGKLDFTVEVPETGTYDLSVFANSLNTYELIAEQGPTNVFLSVDGAQEQEVFLPLAYKWVVWDHSDTTVELTAGTHTISLAARSLDGSGATRGDALIDRITLTREEAKDAPSVYEAELSDFTGAADYESGEGISGSGSVTLDESETATFWVYGARDAEGTVSIDTVGAAHGSVAVNGQDVLDLENAQDVPVHLQGGVNKVTVTGGAGSTVIDRVLIGAAQNALPTTEIQAEAAELAGEVAATELSLAEGGVAVSGIGGALGNGNTLTFRVAAEDAGPHAVVVRYSNPEQVPATHYNPNPMARHADVSVNGAESQRLLFPPTFHQNNFWERTIVFDLKEGENTIAFGSEEQPNFDGVTYAESNWPGIPLRADEAPIIDRITVSPLSAPTAVVEPVDTSVLVVPNRVFAKAGAEIKVRGRIATADRSAPVGTVTVTDRGRVIATAELTAAARGRVDITLPTLRRGTHLIRTSFTGAEGWEDSRAIVPIPVIIW